VIQSIYFKRKRRVCILKQFEYVYLLTGAVILGDSAYGLREWLIPPINRNPDDPIERRFNQCHKSTRRIVENTIGILKEKFPCLNHLRLQPVKTARVALACVVLHNVARTVSRDDEDMENFPTGNISGDEIVDQEVDDSSQTTDAASRRLSSLLAYFRM
jgi:hypothetical protein